MRGTGESPISISRVALPATTNSDLPIGREHDGVRAVLAAAAQDVQALDLVEPVIAVGIGDPIEPAAVPAPFVDDDVQAVERPEQPVSFADRSVDRRDLDDTAVAPDRRQDDSIELAVLVRHDQAALGIDSHVDPRTLRFPGHGVKLLDHEAREGPDPGGGGRRLAR